MMAIKGKTKKGLVRMVSIALVVLMVLSLAISGLSVAFAATTIYNRSGISSVPKLSREEIAKALEDTEFSTPASPWSVAPSYAGYRSGTLSKDVGQKATDRLNALRVLAGLTQVTYNEKMAAGAQSAALLMSTAGIIEDRPAQPADMSDQRYEELLPCAQSCVFATTSSFCDAIDGWMVGKNDATLYARRSQLNPNMPWVGYGYAKNPSTSWWLYKGFCAAAMTSGSSYKPNYDFIAWPASGYFPNNIFDGDTWWSLSLNPEIYQQPDADKVQVLLTRDVDSTSWVLYNGRGDCNTSGHTIMFKPDDVSKYTGNYTVRVSGLQSVKGGDSSVVYRVEFFDTGDFLKQTTPDPVATPTNKPDELPPRDPNTDPVMPSVKPDEKRPTPKPAVVTMQAESPEFTDVPRVHWAYSYIDKAARCGVVFGMGGNKYSPNEQITGYEFATILLRFLYRDEFNKVSDTEPWTVKIDRVASTCGLWDGLSSMQRAQPINRNQMATMIANAVRGTKLIVVTNADRTAVPSRFVDWSEIPSGHRNDVATCVSNGILDGVGDSRFGGSQSMDRAQAATVFCRLYDLSYKM